MIRRLLKNILGKNCAENTPKLANLNWCIILLMFLASGIMLFFLPEQIPILHNGAADYPIPSILGVWLFPITALIIHLTFIHQKRLTRLNSVIFIVLFVIMLSFYLSVM